MQDYMRALKERFDTPRPQDAAMKEEADGLFHELCSVLGKNDCKKLVRLVDIEDARSGKASLNSFISGFKLAWGIFRELTEEPLYSFEEEQEERARRLFMESLQR